MVHDLETRNPAILARTQAFLNQRAATKLTPSGKPARVKLSGGGTAYEDEWTTRGGTVYSGRIYPDATEILTTGIERPILAPRSFAQQDPEYFQFLIQTLQQ